MTEKTKDIILNPKDYTPLTGKDLSFLDEDYELKDDDTNKKIFMYKVLDVKFFIPIVIMTFYFKVCKQEYY